jgi:23S rRNA (guanosine2251-2'-O)-methyltransferase
MYGLHPVQAALDHAERRKKRLLVTENALGRLRVPKSVRAEKTPVKKLDQLFPQGTTHQGVVLEVEPLEQPTLTDIIPQGKHLLMLDQVTDPHNIGAILRTAAAFDVGAILMQDRHAPGENATIAKIAAGGLEHIPLITETNLSRTIKALQEAGYWAIGLSGHTETALADITADRPTLLVMGAEGKGLRRLVAESCDQLAKLPIHPRMESLNVSVAAGIALYQLTNSISA